MDLYRELVATDRAAFLPDLACTLDNLAIRRAETADRRTAVAAATEAVKLYSELTATTPTAFLPDLARALNNLAGHHAGLGGVGDALAAYDAVQGELRAAGPGAVGRIGYERAAFQLRVGDTASGARALVALVQPRPTETVVQQTVHLCRTRLRTLVTDSVDGARAVSEAWSKVVGGAEPAWLHLSERTVGLTDAWLNCPTWSASLAFWTANAASLQAPEVKTALREVALVEPDLAGIHLDLLTRAAHLGRDAAFRPLVLRELAADWMDAPNWLRSQEFLTDHAAELLRPEAVSTLGDSTEPEVLVHLALLHLAAEVGITAAYECVEDRAALHDQVQLTLARGDAASLRHCAALERYVFQDAFPGVAHEMAAEILAGGSEVLDADRRLAQAATALDESTHNRTAAEISELARRRPDQAAELGELLDAVLSAGPPRPSERARRRPHQVASSV